MNILRELISLEVDSALAVAESVKSNHYLDSGEFTDDFYKVVDHVKGIKEIIGSPKWNAWLKDIDNNYSMKGHQPFEVNSVKVNAKVVSEFNKLDAALDKLEKELDKAR